jgi:hypothetical protein
MQNYPTAFHSAPYNLSSLTASLKKRIHRSKHQAKCCVLVHSGDVGIHIIFTRLPASCFDQGISFVPQLSASILSSSLFSSPPFFFFHASSTFISSSSFPVASFSAAFSYSFFSPPSHSFLQRLLIFCLIFFLIIFRILTSYHDFLYLSVFSYSYFAFIFSSLRFSTSSLS